jgi:hypothetical protein
MQTRVEITEIKHSLWKYPELRENLERLDDEVLKFCNITGGDIDDALRILKARRHFESCLTICKSFIDPETNDYIEKVNDKLHSYDFFIDGIGNSLAVLDKLESELESLDEQTVYKSHDKIKSKISFKSYKFREKLKDYMENMIIFPFISAIKNFYNFPNEIKGNKVVKDKNLFMYLLFRELYGTIEIKGSEKRQLQFITGSGKVNMSETNIYKNAKNKPIQLDDYGDTNPPEIPENIRLVNPFEESEDVEADI